MQNDFQKNKFFILPHWKVNNNINAVTTTKLGGVSTGQYSSFNISNNVGDLESNVLDNRDILKKRLNLPSQPLWLKQIHSNRVILHKDYYNGIEADAIICNEKNIVCAIQAADCLPILLCNDTGQKIAAIHAGWRGLYLEIIKHTVMRMECKPHTLQAWIGPGISSKYYSVNTDLYNKFLDSDTIYQKYFDIKSNGEIYADLRAIAKTQLEKLNIKNITISSWCTFNDHRYFYSYRKNKITGRQASLIWLT